MHRTGRQQFGWDDSDSGWMPSDADESVDGEQQSRSEKEVEEAGRLRHAPGAVYDDEDEEDRVSDVDDPERTVGVLRGVEQTRREDEDELDCQQHSGHTW